MAESGRIQFSLFDVGIAEKLRTIPRRYRAFCVENALDAWFQSGQGRDRTGLPAFGTGSIETQIPVRFRLKLSNPSIIERLQAVPSRHKSVITELALAAWSGTQSDQTAFEPFPQKNSRRVAPVPENVSSDHQEEGPTGMDVSDTEQLIKSALQFD